MDSFYRVLNENEHELAGQNKHNFDHPDAFDFELLKQTLQRLKEGKKVEVPIYNFVTHRREAKTTSMYGANVLIFEGIIAINDKVSNPKVVELSRFFRVKVLSPHSRFGATAPTKSGEMDSMILFIIYRMS